MHSKKLTLINKSLQRNKLILGITRHKAAALFIRVLAKINLEVRQKFI
jgi:hypothetical protein